MSQNCKFVLTVYYFLLLCISVVFLSVFLSGFFTVLYSMQWGHTKSVDWLTTFLLSIVQSIVCVQPVKVSIYCASSFSISVSLSLGALSSADVGDHGFPHLPVFCGSDHI